MTPIDSVSVVLDRFNMSLGAGLGRLKGRVFRIGHLGDFNELMLIGTLGGVELGLAAAGVPFTAGGVQAAIAEMTSEVVLQKDVKRPQRPLNTWRTLLEKRGDAFAEIIAVVTGGDSRSNPSTFEMTSDGDAGAGPLSSHWIVSGALRAIAAAKSSTTSRRCSSGSAMRVTRPAAVPRRHRADVP